MPPLVHDPLKQLCEDLNCEITHELPPSNPEHYMVIFKDDNVTIHDFESIKEVQEYLEKWDVEAYKEARDEQLEKQEVQMADLKQRIQEGEFDFNEEFDPEPPQF